MFPKHSFVRIKEEGGPKWAGKVGCIVGYDQRRKHAYKLSLVPDGDLSSFGLVTIRVSEDVLEYLAPAPVEKIA